MNRRTIPASRPRRATSRPRVGLALAGGGPLGAIYEIGALAALTEALDGIDFNDADVYVGVSAGGFIAAGLANGITPHQMSRLFIEGEKGRDRFEPSILLRPAFREYAQRLGIGAPAHAQRGLALPPGRQHHHERLRAARPGDPDRRVQRRRGRPLPVRHLRPAGPDQRLPPAGPPALPGRDRP